MKGLFCFLLAVFLSIITLHPGGTDANGGHYDRSTGEYHYHHGYPAHQHPNGVCPYETKETTRSIPPEPEPEKRSIWEILENIFLVFVAVYSVYRIVWVLFVQPRLEERFWRERNRNIYSNNYRRRERLPAPALEKPYKFTPSPKQQEALDRLSLREDNTLQYISIIVSEYLDCYGYQNNQDFISAIASSFSKVEDDDNVSAEYTARRIISRACFAYLLYLQKYNLINSSSSIPPKEILRMFQDSMKWLLHHGYYTRLYYDNMVDAINYTLNKKSKSQEH